MYPLSRRTSSTIEACNAGLSCMLKFLPSQQRTTHICLARRCAFIQRSTSTEPQLPDIVNNDDNDADRLLSVALHLSSLITYGSHYNVCACDRYQTGCPRINSSLTLLTAPDRRKVFHSAVSLRTAPCRPPPRRRRPRDETAD